MARIYFSFVDTIFNGCHNLTNSSTRAALTNPFSEPGLVQAGKEEENSQHLGVEEETK